MNVNNFKKPTSIIGQTGDCGKEDDVCVPTIIIVIITKIKKLLLKHLTQSPFKKKS